MLIPEGQTKGGFIENIAYDLKAVNPNRTVHEDTRTPNELLDFIAAKSQKAGAALLKLRKMVGGV
jgi:type I restriction enzyme M protein